MKNMHVLEERILSCWNIVEDLECLSENAPSKEFAEALKGLAYLYNLRFNSTFKAYEEAFCEVVREIRKGHE
jgi:hypothetical protein